MNTVSQFPDPNEADDSGLLCVGGTFDVDILYDAYSKGIFPWPQEGLPLLWFSPPLRGVLDFDDLHVPKTLGKCLAKKQYDFSWNGNFERVIRSCQIQPRKGQVGTWITEDLIQGYLLLHQKGYAHSLEAWKGTDLVGGIYGVFVRGVFSGESMFGLESNVSKLCLIALTRELQARWGLKWMDIQMVTPVLAALGGKLVTREIFLERLQLEHLKLQS